MPSLQHEALRSLFQNRPELTPILLRDALGVELPAYSSIRTESADLSQIVPAEYRADLVVLLVNNDPALAIVVEVQLRTDGDKRFSWPAYVVGLRARSKCPALVLVVTPNPAVADWAAQPIDIGPGATLTPTVVGPDAVPYITNITRALASPELAVLSVMAHGKEDPESSAKLALTALEAVAKAGLGDYSVLYSDLILDALSEAARKALQMIPQGYEFKTPFIRDALQKGEAKGRAEGRAEGVLAVLEARGLVVSDHHREKILSSADAETLAVWLRRAVTVSCVDELFVQ